MPSRSAINAESLNERGRKQRRNEMERRIREKGNPRNSRPNYTKKIQPVKAALTAAKHQDMIMRACPSLPPNLLSTDLVDVAAAEMVRTSSFHARLSTRQMINISHISKEIYLLNFSKIFLPCLKMS